VNNSYFKVHAECKAIKGFNRSLIYDLPRQEMAFIDNEVLDAIKNTNKIKVVVSELEKQNYDDVNKIIDWLISNEYIFLCSKNEIKLFPDISDEWDYPAPITNSIIDYNNFSEHQLSDILIQLDKLNCHHIQIRYFDDFIIENLDKALGKIRNSKIVNIELLFKYDKEIGNKKITELCRKHTRLGRVFIYNSNEETRLNDSSYRAQIIFAKENVESSENCGVISAKYFSTNIEVYTESQHHNTCLNRKVCIDANGEIKNCPSMSKSYGNIKNTTLDEAIEKPGFKDCWFIHKDQIDVCNDCEFRHMCTDCRAFIKDPNNIYSQPAKCPFNPYIAKWEGEEGYVPVEECGAYSKENGFVINKRKVNKLNKQIWGE
jgi:SPASM domain peptide maturase of grasp-with-spasm system